MKTVIESPLGREQLVALAREAGLFVFNDSIHPRDNDEPLNSYLERFAALVREDERERNGRGDYMEGLEEGYAAGQRDEREKQNHSEQDLNMVQEPVAWMEDSIEFYAKDHPTSSCTIPLYTTPPTAALAARQMRDSVFTALLAAETPYTQMTMMQKKVFGDAIAALPVPEVQWRDLTDEDKQQLQDYWRSHKGKHHEMTDFDVTSIVCDSVIAKFKELNT